MGSDRAGDVSFHVDNECSKQTHRLERVYLMINVFSLAKASPALQLVYSARFEERFP